MHFVHLHTHRITYEPPSNRHLTESPVESPLKCDDYQVIRFAESAESLVESLIRWGDSGVIRRPPSNRRPNHLQTSRWVQEVNDDLVHLGHGESDPLRLRPGADFVHTREVPNVVFIRLQQLA